MMTNSAQAVPLTESSVAWLRQELDRLRQEREPALVERLREIQQEAGFHDLQAHVVRDELTRVRERIHELEITLETASAPDGRHAPDVITIGSRVIVRDEAGREHTFVIVSPVEADAGRGHISAASPVGAALLGRRSGDAVAVTTPTGTRRLLLLSVE